MDAWDLCHTWGATRAWCGRRGWAVPGKQLHHWLVPQRLGNMFGYDILWLINQHWNLRPLSSVWHQAVHGYRRPRWIGWPGRILIGPPTWLKTLPLSVGTRIHDASQEE